MMATLPISFLVFFKVSFYRSPSFHPGNDDRLCRFAFVLVFVLFFHSVMCMDSYSNAFFNQEDKLNFVCSCWLSTSRAAVVVRLSVVVSRCPEIDYSLIAVFLFLRKLIDAECVSHPLYSTLSYTWNTIFDMLSRDIEVIISWSRDDDLRYPVYLKILAAYLKI